MKDENQVDLICRKCHSIHSFSKRDLRDYEDFKEYHHFLLEMMDFHVDDYKYAICPTCKSRVYVTSKELSHLILN